MEYNPQLFVSAAVVLLYVIILLRNKRKRNGAKLPPGPKAFPIIGNLLDMPKTAHYLTFDKWTKQYGDICYVQALGKEFIILGSARRTDDIFVNRSTTYSDRLVTPMLELAGWGTWNLTLQSYGPNWRAHRKTFGEHFRPSVVSRYHHIQLKKVHVLLGRLLDTPNDFLYHIRHTISSVIMSITYGIETRDTNDPFVEIAEEALYGLSQTGNPGAFLIDFLPFLRYVPEWFPGANFQRHAARWRWAAGAMVDLPWNVVKDAMNEGTAAPSVASLLLENVAEADEKELAATEQISKNCAGVAFVGGADTTVSAAQSFILAMAIYPEIQKKAQQELDSVLGGERLPSFDDHDSLPFINAIVKETLRWKPVLPIGVPHLARNDDIYDGYFIPKNSVVIGNTWSILHDPEIYPEPEEFRPERFIKNGRLDPEVKDPEAAFGYGRRICPGQYMASNSLYAIVCSLLSVFDITAPLDDSGNPLKLHPEMTDMTISFPLPFKCNIKPRSAAATTLIRDCI